MKRRPGPKGLRLLVWKQEYGRYLSEFYTLGGSSASGMADGWCSDVRILQNIKKRLLTFVCFCVVKHCALLTGEAANFI